MERRKADIFYLCILEEVTYGQTDMARTVLHISYSAYTHNSSVCTYRLQYSIQYVSEELQPTLVLSIAEIFQNIAVGELVRKEKTKHRAGESSLTSLRHCSQIGRYTFIRHDNQPIEESPLQCWEKVRESGDLCVQSEWHEGPTAEGRGKKQDRFESLQGSNKTIQSCGQENYSEEWTCSARIKANI